jgi:hypothetical protein
VAQPAGYYQVVTIWNKMKKTLIALTVLAGTLAAQTPAIAQNTAQAWQFRKDTCLAVGMRAANAWSYREAKDPYPFNTISPGTSTVLHMWAINYATNAAGSREEAIKVSVAKCFDNVDKVYRDERGGHQTTVDELR